jgi:heme-degrading monooxygenase HmoA
MVITVLEAKVTEKGAPILRKTFTDAVKQLDKGIVETYLLHSMKDPTIWQIVTQWESAEALDAMRKSGETPRGVLIFRSAEAEPVLSIYEVAVTGKK